jgi:hypothetical protein
MIPVAEVPAAVWIALVLAVTVFAFVTRRWINWLAVVGVLVLALLLSRCEPDDFLIPGLPVPSEPPTDSGSQR